MALYDLIFGGFGQDGSITSSLLRALQRPHIRIGSTHHDCFSSSNQKNECFQGGICRQEKISLDRLESLFAKHMARDIYFFAAYHASSETPLATLADNVTALAVNYEYFKQILDLIETKCGVRSVFYANSMKIFEGSNLELIDEQVPSAPVSSYALSKAMTRELIRVRKDNAKFKIYNGILFNHESAHRKDIFFSAKVINQAIDVARGRRTQIEINTLRGAIDMGLARDYCDAIVRLSDSGLESGDYVFASGTLVSLRYFVETVLKILSISQCPIIETNHAPPDKKSPRAIRGDNSKLLRGINLKVRIPEEWIRLLVMEHLERRGMPDYFDLAKLSP